MKHFVHAALLVGLVCGLPSLSRAQVILYSTTLSGPAESPPNASAGTGFAFVTLDLTLKTMRLQTTFSGLTGNVTASHIHAATALPGVGTAGVATQTPTFSGFPLGNTFGMYDNTFDMTLASSFNPAYITAHGGTTAQAFTDLSTAIAGGQAYLNVHSSAFPGGEVRGFLAPAAAPEPGTLALVALGGLGVALRLRRARNS